MAGKGSVAPFFTRGVSLTLIAFIALIVVLQYALPRVRGAGGKDRNVILQ
jgi:hypothetical protein